MHRLLTTIRRQQSIAPLAAALILSAALVLLDGKVSPLQGWLAYSLVAVTIFAGLWAVWRKIGASPAAGWAALAALTLRLAVGVGLTFLLPAFGYADSEPSQAGYLYQDAYRRDTQARILAISTEPIATAFSGRIEGDQYGGTLALSALVYRYLSPDEHRPWLILLLTSGAAALGALLTWGAGRVWLGEGGAALAAWVMALYPESVFLGASPMREAYVMAGVSLAMYAVIARRRAWALWLLAAGGWLMLIQPPALLATLVLAAMVWALDAPRGRSWRQAALFGGLLLAGAVAVIVAWSSLPALQGANPLTTALTWLQKNFAYQSGLAERSSGMMQLLLDKTPPALHGLVVLVYGLAQPVLPATLVDTAPLLWQVVNSLRAAGWYLLAPMLVYGVSAALRAQPPERRRQWLAIGGVALVWVGIAALNAGADQWDNPRYRVILLPWLALLAAWAWGWGRAQADAWLGRFYLLDGLFVVLFLEWYLSREYPDVFFHLDLLTVAAITLALAALLVFAGWQRDRRRKRNGMKR